MSSEIVSDKNKEKMFFLSIKNEIDGMVDTKLHSLYKSGALHVQPEKVDEECRNQFFEGLSHVLEKSIKMSGEFYEYLERDDPDLFAKVLKELEPISKKVVECQSIQEVLSLSSQRLSKEDENKIYAIGMKHFKEEHLEAAYLYFAFLTLMDAENSHYWLARGMVEQNLAKYQEALRSYLSAINLTPGVLVIYIQIMDTLLLMKRYEEAQNIYEAFMREVDPEHYIHNSFILSKLNVVRSFMSHAAA